MIKLKNQVKIPSWISCRTYFFGEEESRTYIANEKNHSYIQLDGLASDMWKMLCDNIDDELFLQWAQEHGVTEEVADFIYQLQGQDLVVLSAQANENGIDEGYQPLNENDGDEEKLFVDEMQQWLYSKKFLYSLFFELTYRCDLKCVHCYNPKHMASIELDVETCKRAIDEAYDLGCFRVTFSGGEATLHTKFIELVRYARSKYMSVEIFTNGQTLIKNEETYKKLIGLYPYRICVSLYSMEKETHDKVTAVGGSFENTHALVRKLRENNVNVQIKNFLLNFNCMHCIQVKDFAKEVGATSIADLSLIPTIEGDKKTLQYELDENSLFALYTDKNSPLYIGEDFKKFDFEKIKDGALCKGGMTGLCVTPKGEVTICVSMPYIVGNLNEDSLKDIWNFAMAEEETSKLYQWLKLTIKDLGECYKEEYCKFCNYCPGMGYLENGYLKRSDVLCKQAKIKMKAYNTLKERENN